jgi:feruloyl esterase
MPHYLPFIGVTAGLALAWPAAGAQAASCESLSALSLPHTTMTLAASVGAGQFSPPAGRGRGGPGGASAFATLPPFCRVAATLRPTADSDIKIEVWMPATGWNGKFLAMGNGGWAGSIGYGALADGVRRGYATVSTDTGHEGGNARFILGHPEKLVDFAERAVHEMTVAGKSIARAFYDAGPRFSYFNGCSTGGRQALTAAQRFPDDYDGIIGGAPAIYGSHQSAGQLWIWNATHENEAGFLSQDKLAVLHDAVLRACDARDGVADGVLEDPTICAFDPGVVQCRSGDGPDCLTVPQVEAARKIYAGPVNPRTGERIFPGLAPGSELGWAASAGERPVGYAIDLYRYVVFEEENWDPLTLDYDRDVARAARVATPLIAVDPDLSRLVASDGKLLIYMGWSDPGIPPGYAPEYYRNVVSSLGPESAQDSVRLYMVPGMGHCGGGDGTSAFDMIGVMEEWVEQGKTPDRIPASRVRNGQVDRTRPLCPYPQVAVYSGRGSTDEAESFACEARRSGDR